MMVEFNALSSFFEVVVRVANEQIKCLCFEKHGAKIRRKNEMKKKMAKKLMIFCNSGKKVYI